MSESVKGKLGVGGRFGNDLSNVTRNSFLRDSQFSQQLSIVDLLLPEVSRRLWKMTHSTVSKFRRVTSLSYAITCHTRGISEAHHLTPQTGDSKRIIAQ